MTITFRGPCRNRVLNPRQPLLQGSRQEVVPVLPVILVRTTSWGMIGNTITITDGIANHTPTSGPNKDYWKDWDYFLSRPLEEWLPGIKDPITAWASKGDGHGKGWESFFTGRVHEARRASEASTKKEVRA